MDAVYIGSSRVYSFWNPLFAYSRYGITVYNLSTSAQSIDMAQYLIEEAHKTQPNAVMIVNLEPIHEGSKARIHRVIDRMRFSFTKVKLSWRMGKENGDRFLDRFKYLFPLIRYHSRWQKLEKDDFLFQPGKYMSASRYDSYLSGHLDVSNDYQQETGKQIEPDAKTREVIDSLLDYCKREQIEILFTLAPQAGIESERMEARTGLKNYICSCGGTVFDFQNCLDDIGLDLEYDYDNGRHTNIHGSAKFTAYLSKKLIERYNLTDKRGMKGYKAWENALGAYHELVDSFVLPFEWNAEKYGNLPQPKFAAAISPEGGVSVSWETVLGADGYAIYRKTARSEPWECLGEVTEDGFIDKEGKMGYYYLVAPFMESDSVRYYGTVDYQGVIVQ